MSDDAPTAVELLAGVDAVLLRAPGQRTTLVLPPEHAFVALQRGVRPTIIPINDPGRWRIDALAFDDQPGGLPALIVAVPRTHLAAWAALTDPVIDETIAKAIALQAAGDAPPSGTRTH
jgi:hypothetical protein